MNYKVVSDCLRLALMYEVAATPKPGCIDRRHDHPDTTFRDFISSAVAVSRSFEENNDSSVGELVLDSTKRMVNSHSGMNTHFGAILLNAPLYLAAVQVDDYDIESIIKTADKIVKASSVDDAIKFYESFRHVEVGGLKQDIEELDAESTEAIIEISRDSITFKDLMEISSEHDDIARETIDCYPRTVEAYNFLKETPLENNDIVECFIKLLKKPDTHVMKAHSIETAEKVSRKAKLLFQKGVPEKALNEFDRELNEGGVSPGTTADILSSSLFLTLLSQAED
ncbi:triphosphoribosyl-dephospho-CoA synthase [Methanonatronarchaeum sp. AMET6-2]|uniref:triphosphoribosyl-dephospho-CoA synthase n=1 Tax=Methanonatronarchaeum sp. AMET6-2 TaxID=2933293 RepID=UPI00121E7D37|nr:triphosphoribosyl-dephospho-CoA synthase [Methanonatronarchaeum sp. AMET6-2]RZN62912.1 MAG: hypothetical protein EF811_01645 [Methanonatronarchaeia archaeon]UOY09843.1 triphosphoribosyl-dephospho-CoA synthase [Methanonatronarchaeum sp. AMET6-2]